jgi:soluble lytic murein transglycosylase-like protein
MNITEMVNLITVVAQLNGVSPQLAVAVASVESKMNPKAVGSVGEIGLFQVKPSSVGLSRQQLFDPATNIVAGVEYLKHVKKHCHTKEDFTFVICYNAGVTGAKRIKHPKQFSYYKKVMEVKGRIKRGEACLK